MSACVYGAICSVVKLSTVGVLGTRIVLTKQPLEGAGYPSPFLEGTWIKDRLKSSTSPWVKDDNHT